MVSGGDCTSHKHHGEKNDEQVGVMPKGEVSLHAHILKHRGCSYRQM